MIITKVITSSGSFDVLDKNKDEVLKDIKECEETNTFYIVKKETTASYKNKLCKDNITIYLDMKKVVVYSFEEHLMEEIPEEKPLKSKKK